MILPRTWIQCRGAGGDDRHQDAESGRLTLGQQAAVARIAYAVQRPPAVVLLCGPAGVGKTLVLDAVSALPGVSDRLPSRCNPSSAAESITASSPILLVDDAHLAADGQLTVMLGDHFQRHPPGVVVLAGEGRLLSLVARDRRLEQMVTLRAIIAPFTLEETRTLVAPRIEMRCSPADRDDVVRTIHEIAAGIPSVALRLVDMASIIAAATPGRSLIPQDIEALYRRLFLQAA
jgi:type II secretory pathway predicted ATPase ExeA